MTITTTSLVSRLEFTCPHCSEKLSEEYPAPAGEPMGYPIVKCPFCGEEFYDPRIIEYYDLPEEEAKAMDAVIPNYQKVWSKIEKVCWVICLVSMVAVFMLAQRMFTDDLDMFSFWVDCACANILVISLFLEIIAKNVKGTAGDFLHEKKESSNRMKNIANVTKLKKYKEEYKAPEANSAMDMSALDFIKKADELMSADEPTGGES